MKNNKKVLIVGVNGFLGKELAGFLEGKGVEVFGTTHTSNISKNIFQFKYGVTLSIRLKNRTDILQRSVLPEGR